MNKRNTSISEYQKRRISEGMKGRKRSDAERQAIKEGLARSEKKLGKPGTKVVQINRYNGRTMRIWNSVSDAAKALYIQPGNIVHCAKGRRGSAGGYIWLYYQEETE